MCIYVDDTTHNALMHSPSNIGLRNQTFRQSSIGHINPVRGGD